MTLTPKQQPNINWRALMLITTYYAYFYAAMEWLFFATKPSSLSTLTLFENAKVLFITGGIAALAALIITGLLSLPALLVKHPVWRSRMLYLACLPPALILSITALLMLDNFTYTVFNFGIVSTVGIWRAVYALGFTGFALWTIWRVKKSVQKRWKPASIPALILLAVSIISIFTVIFSRNINLTGSSDGSNAASSRPNIIMIAGDGLNAQYLSLYGASLDTTPFLRELSKTSLLAENAFTNASGTTASTTSLFTGREPAEVKVYRYPDILEGNASYEHLPGILKRMGYQTVEIGTPYYMDAVSLNLLDGFDIVNGKSLNQPLALVLRSVLGNSPATYFVANIFSRADERLLHIFFIRVMTNPLKEIDSSHAEVNDEQKVNQITDLLDHADRPLFITAYMLDTHGPHFNSNLSDADVTTGNENWDIDLYKDAIRSFDGSVKKIYDHLVQNGQLENTIFVVFTDHGYQYTIFNRIPIMIHFPNDEHAGVRYHNIQMIDMPVTILDYLGVPQPNWMTGISFLNNEPPIDRRIFSVEAGSPTKIAPPFYQIKTVQAAVCQYLYQLNVQQNKFSVTAPSGYTPACSPDSLPPDAEIHQEILKYLKDHGYDVSSLQ
jgi:hypothetical protein